MFEREFAKRLKRIRLYKNLTQQKVADYLNITRSAYSYYESGTSEPSLKSLLKLSRFYGVSTDLLLTGKRRKLP
ncbi:MAG: helix-turn-helix transcriptional regulator [Clostridia bacterium]